MRAGPQPESLVLRRRPLAQPDFARKGSLTVLGLLNSAVAAYYYLRLLVAMYFRDPADGAAEVKPLTPAFGAALFLPAVGTLVLGIFPSWVLDFATKSAAMLK